MFLQNDYVLHYRALQRGCWLVNRSMDDKTSRFSVVSNGIKGFLSAAELVCIHNATCGEDQGSLLLKAARSNTSYTEKVCDREKTLAPLCMLSVIPLNTGEHTEWCTVVMVRRI